MLTDGESAFEWPHFKKKIRPIPTGWKNRMKDLLKIIYCINQNHHTNQGKTLLDNDFICALFFHDQYTRLYIDFGGWNHNIEMYRRHNEIY